MKPLAFHFPSILIVRVVGATIVLAAVPSMALSQDAPRQARLAVAPATTSLCVSDPSAHEVEDVRARAAQMRTRDGVVTLGRTSTGLRLVAIAQGGRVLDYAVVDAEGRTAPTLSTLAVSPTGDDCNPCCWKCGKDGGGTVHCWQIECPVIVSNTGGGD
jgi:hypothetical protein